MNASTTFIYDFAGSRYVSLTNKCSMKCHFCPRTSGSYQIGEHNLRQSKGKRRPEVQHFIDLLGDLSEVNEVVFCGYGESTERLSELLEISEWCKSQGAVTRLNTNGHGQFYNRRSIVSELVGLIDHVSVSLNAQNEELYNHHCVPRFNGAYKMMLRFSSECVKAGLDIQMSAIDGLDGVSIPECEQIALNLGAKFKYRKLDLMIDKE